MHVVHVWREVCVCVCGKVNTSNFREEMRRCGGRGLKDEKGKLVGWGKGEEVLVGWRRGEGVLVGWRREQGIGGGVKKCLVGWERT